MFAVKFINDVQGTTTAYWIKNKLYTYFTETLAANFVVSFAKVMITVWIGKFYSLRLDSHELDFRESFNDKNVHKSEAWTQTTAKFSRACLPSNRWRSRIHLSLNRLKKLLFRKLIELACSDHIGKHWPLFASLWTSPAALFTSLPWSLLLLVRLLNPDRTFETDRVSVFAKIVSYIAKLIRMNLILEKVLRSQKRGMNANNCLIFATAFVEQ